MKIYSKESLIDALKEIKNRGWILNARPGHNHGTKFRLRQNSRPQLYSNIQEIT